MIKKTKSITHKRGASNKLPIDLFAEKISARWRETVKSIFAVGRLLREAKDALAHGEFEKMVESRLPFGPRAARMLMAVAADRRLTNASAVERLPPHWYTLYQLTRLNDEQFKRGIESGLIRPDMERAEIIEGTIVPEGASSDTVNGARSIMASRVEPDGSLDYFPTPPWATRAMIERVLPQIGRRADFGECSALEPACGEGHIAEVLAEYAKSVRASDVFAYGYGETLDFLRPNLDALPRADWIITNPPFEERAEAFVLRAIERARVGVAMFLRLQWLETVGRYDRIFKPYPPTLIAQFSERVPLHRGRWEPDGDTATAYLWIIWLKNSKKPTRFFWIPPGCREDLTRPDDRDRFTAHPVTRRAAPVKRGAKRGPKPKQLSLLPTERTVTLTNPKLLPSPAAIAAIADRAARKRA